MANLNKVMLIGRLTRDPEPIQTKSNPQAGAKFGFAVNNRKKNQDTQQWEDVPVFIDMEIWNWGESKQADRVLQTLRKGQQVFIEGHLRMDQWDDKNGGGKRSKLMVVVESFQYLEPRTEGGMGGGEPMQRAARPAPARQPAAATPRNGGGGYAGYDDGPDSGGPANRGGAGGGGGTEDEIPF
ncbi:MAG: single-stranded DNA-binding protein [Gemmataceae bacterium]